MPKISVIVPIYKVEAYLPRCVESILGQTHADFELILVDDGSPDNCPQMCDDYAKKDKRIVTVHKQNGGLSDARNAGIDWAFENSDSEWIAFVDSDDYLREDYLEKLYSACIENNADICMCDFKRVNEADEDVEKPHEFPQGIYKNKEDFFGFMYYNWRTIVAWNKLYRKTLFNSVRYDFGKIHEDEFIIHKLLAECDTICYLQEPLYLYLVRNGSIMSDEKRIIRELLFLEVNIKRYWFCKENELPVDCRITDVSYMSYVQELKDRVGETEKKYYMQLHKEYRQVFVDAARCPLKYKLLFDGYKYYKK